MQTSWETIHETKAKKKNDVEKNVFYVKLNLFKNNFYKTHFQKQPFTNALRNRFSENLQYSELQRDSNTGVFL